MSLKGSMEKMCRACLNTNEKHSELVSLFSGESANAGIPTKIINVSNVMIHEQDGLPNMICQKCIFLVKITDCFKKQLEMADMELRKIWDRAEGIDSINNVEPNFTADGTSDSEDLAYNPSYISDNVKERVERAFRRKHQMLENREFEEMSQFLTNLEKERSVKAKIKREKLECIVDKRSALEDIEKPDLLIKNRNDETSDIAKMDVSDSSAENSSEDNLKIEIPTTLEDFELLETEEPGDSNEVAKVVQRKTEQNIKTGDKVIVVSDASDIESESGEKSLHKSLPNSRSVAVRPGQNRESVEDATLKKASVSGMPVIQVKKVFQSVQVGNTHRLETKTVPQTYFLCTSCNIRLKSVAAVLLHHNEVHSPNKDSLHCRMCDKSFSTKSHLLKHFDQHIDTHLFRCSYCPNEFVLKANLTKHMLNHTNETPLETANKGLKVSVVNSKEERKPKMSVVDSMGKRKLKTSDFDSTQEKKMKTNAVDSTEEMNLRTRDVHSMQMNKPEKQQTGVTKRDEDFDKENTRNS